MGKKEHMNITETLHHDSLNPGAMGLFPIFESLFDTSATLPSKQKSLKKQRMNTGYNCTYCDKKFREKRTHIRHEEQCLKSKKSFKWRENSNECAGQNTSIEDNNTPKKEENDLMKEKHTSKTQENDVKKSPKNEKNMESDFDSEIPLLPIIPERSHQDEVENLNKTSCQICPFCQSRDFDRHNCEKYEKALHQTYCTLCRKNVHEGFMKIHLEFDCKITNFFGIKMPQPYIEPEILTDSPMIQEIYSLEDTNTTGKLHY